MACRIEVGLKPELPDPTGDTLLRKISELGVNVSSVHVLMFILWMTSLARKKMRKAGADLFSILLCRIFQ